jgi:hypothetical protein
VATLQQNFHIFFKDLLSRIISGTRLHGPSAAPTSKFVRSPCLQPVHSGSSLRKPAGLIGFSTPQSAQSVQYLLTGHTSFSAVLKHLQHHSGCVPCMHMFLYPYPSSPGSAATIPTSLLWHITHREAGLEIPSGTYSKKKTACGLVVRVPSYRSRGPGFNSRRYQIF